MASEFSIQVRITEAIEELEQIAREHGITEELPRNARGGQNMIRAVQLETIVGWVKQLLSKPAVVVDEPIETPKPPKRK